MNTQDIYHNEGFRRLSERHTLEHHWKSYDTPVLMFT